MMRFDALPATALSSLVTAAFGADAPTRPKEHPVTTHTATGPFDVKMTPQTMSDVAAHSGLGRMSIDKQFHGVLEAASTGEMLGWRNASGSGGYVAMELVRGTLAGRAGSFMLQHSSTMTRGEPSQSIMVVPDSGTDALTGLTGRMVVDIAPGGAHSYRFEYTLP